MRREVPTPLSNEKVTYKRIPKMAFELHLTLGFLHSKVDFGLSFSQSDSWNFFSLLITIILENVKTLHIPHFGFFTK